MIRPLIACACLMLASCSIKHDFTVVPRAVDEFHHRLDTQQDELIFKEATPEFQKSMSAETSHAFFTRIGRKLGMVTSSSPARTQ